MPDILIRNMEMPDSCFHCFAVIELRNDHDELTAYCSLTKPDSPAEWHKVIDGINHQQERMWFCPLIEIPDVPASEEANHDEP